MTGSDIALATLSGENPGFPCINYSWMTSSSYMSRVTGREYWSDREGVFFEYLRRCGINLVPQWYFPGEAQRRIETGHIAHDHRPGGTEAISSPEEIFRAIDALPDDDALDADFDLERAADEYAFAVSSRIDSTHGEVLFIDSFGQADFMGGYTRWGYEHYLLALAEDPGTMRRYYHYTAHRGRLRNLAIVRAREKHAIAPFVYGGQDICAGAGPIVSPTTLRAIYFPELAWAVEPLLEAGIGIIWHCDGNINPILPDLLALGFTGLQGFEEEHGVRYEEIVGLTRRDGLPIGVWGCVSVTSTMPHGTPDDVRRAVERSFTLAGPGRGFVLSSTSSIMPEVPHANIDALFEHGRSFGRSYLGG